MPAISGAMDVMDIEFDDLPGSSWAEQSEYLRELATANDADDDLEQLPCIPSHASTDNAQAPCVLLDVLGTQDTWQGKGYYVVDQGSKSKAMLVCLPWPVQFVLRACSIQELYRVGSTCRSLHTAAFRLIEERAEEQIHIRFFSDAKRVNFINLFGCFEWALSLKRVLTFNSLQNWNAADFDAAYNNVSARMCVKENEPLCGLKPVAVRQWKRLGRQALESFFKDCVASDHHFRKLLKHYSNAWASIMAVFNINADILLADGQFKQILEIDASWPVVRVQYSLVDTRRVAEWTMYDVYKWFRLKKLPVTGLLKLQLCGKELVQIYLAAGNGAKYAFGMNDAQYQRFITCMDKTLAAPEPPSTSTITFRVYGSSG